MNALDRIPPQNLEMEQSVLGCMLIERAAIEAAEDILSERDFLREAHGVIFEAILSLHRRNEPVDLYTVQEVLRLQGQLENCAGTPYLLTLLNAPTAAAHVEHYAKIVREKAVLRRLIGASADIQALAHSDYEEIDDVLAAVEGLVRDVTAARLSGTAQHIASLVGEVFDELEELTRNPRRVTGIATGIDELDTMTRGWQPSTLVVVGARPGHGKTALMGHFALTAAKAGHRIFIASQEMSKRDIARRMIATAGRVDGQGLRTGYVADDDWRRIGDACGRLSSYSIVVADRQMSLSQLRTHCRRASRDGLDLVLVDYLQLMRSEGRKENRTTEVSALAEGLKDLAVELGVCIIALAQSSRAVDSRPDHRPVLADLRDSGQIEAAADVVIFPYNPLNYQPADKRQECEEMELIVAKNRDGITGSARCLWFAASTAFGNVARGYDEAPARLPYAEDVGR